MPHLIAVAVRLELHVAHPGAGHRITLQGHGVLHMCMIDVIAVKCRYTSATSILGVTNWDK
jgi:hypothetical protein